MPDERQVNVNLSLTLVDVKLANACLVRPPVHHEHHLHDGAHLCLPLCVKLPATHPEHQASGDMASVQCGLPLLGDSCFLSFTGLIRKQRKYRVFLFICN